MPGSCSSASASAVFRSSGVDDSPPLVDAAAPPPACRFESGGRRNSQDLWIGVSRDLLITSDRLV